MGDAMISVVVERVAAIIGDQIRYEVNLIRGVEKELFDLSYKLNTITNVLDDAAKRGVNDHNIKSWLKKLENTAYEMDDILDEWNYSLLKYKMGAFDDEPEPQPEQKTGCSFIPSPCLCFKKVSVRHSTAKKIENVKAKLAQILKEMDDFKFVKMLNGGLATSELATNPKTKPWREQTTHVIDLTKVYGLDIYRKENDIVSKLRLNDGDTQILSIVGTGGIGKTTLAKVVYNDTRVKNCHELRISICVSNRFNVAGIAKGIIDSVGTQKIPPNTNQLALILQKLQESVSGKKFLLVLDDVWTEDESKWNDLKISLQCGARGSTILVTTRNERVAKMMGTLNDNMYRPNILSEEECWSLLCDTSLSEKNEKERTEFEETGKKIAIKCKGLPLAAVVLGRLLQFKDLEGWEHVVKSEIWQLENAKVAIFSHLVLSYNVLSPTLKRCFSYCAVYPKGHRIHVESLIEEWMALGYLGPVSANSGAELKGLEYLNSLAMLSLFQDIEESESGERIEWCKMHDIVHDFALFLRKNDDGASTSCQVCDSLLVSHVQEYRCLSWDHRLPVNESERRFQFCDCLKCLRVLRFKRGPPPVGMETLIHLRCLDFSDIALSKDDLKTICQLYFLQTLLLSLCSIREVPQEIGNLVHLRRLALSYNYYLKELPDSICNLVELRSLSIAYCFLQKIPGEIGNLVQLRQLDLSYNIELKELPESIYNLVELRSLSLSHCFLRYIPREIGNLVQLRQLDFSWNKEMKYLPESICNLVRLQILNIEGTDIYCLPRAVGRLSNLRTLELCVFKVGRDYNKLVFLQNLYSLLTGSLELEIHLSSQSEMEELVEDAQDAQLVIPELKRLNISFKGWMNENERSSSSSMWMELLEALQPHRKLKALRIDEYRGARLLSWMSSPFNLIEEIDLTNLSEVSSLSAMGKLPCLEILSIVYAEQLKLVGREFLGIESSSAVAIVAAFPKLRKLNFSKCNRLEEWEDITVEEEESAAISIMPCLTELAITQCESLKKLPHRILHKASSSLRSMDISGSSELVKVYGEDKEGSTWRSISQHNPQLVLRK